MSWVDIDPQVSDNQSSSGWVDIAASEDEKIIERKPVTLKDELVQGVENVGDALGAVGSKLGATLNAVNANLNEALGVDSSLFRENQQWYQDRYDEYRKGLEKEYGDFGSTIVEEGFNPINYTPVAGASALAKTASFLAPIALGSVMDIGAGRTPKGTSLADDAAKVASDTLLGGIAGKVGGDALSKLNPYNWKKAALKDATTDKATLQKIKNFEEKTGIKVPLSTRYGSQRMALKEQLYDAGDINIGVPNYQKMNDDVMEYTQDFLKAYGAGDSRSEAGAELAEWVSKQTQDTKEAFSKRYDALYEKLGDKNLKDLGFDTEGFKKGLEDFVSKYDNNPLMQSNRAVRDAKKLLKTDWDNLTLNDFNSIKSVVGSRLDDKFTVGNNEQRVYKYLYSMMKNKVADVDDFIQKQKIFSETFGDINQDYAQFKKAFENPDIRNLMRENANPALVGRKLSNNVNYLKQLRGEEPVQRAALTELLQGGKHAGRDELSPNKFMTNINKEGMKDILARNPQMQKEFKSRLEPVIRNMLHAQQGRNKSNSGTFNLLTKSIGRVPIAGEALGSLGGLLGKSFYDSNFYRNILDAYIMDNYFQKELGNAIDDALARQARGIYTTEEDVIRAVFDDLLK